MCKSQQQRYQNDIIVDYEEVNADWVRVKAHICAKHFDLEYYLDLDIV